MHERLKKPSTLTVAQWHQGKATTTESSTIARSHSLIASSPTQENPAMMAYSFDHLMANLLQTLKEESGNDSGVANEPAAIASTMQGQLSQAQEAKKKLLAT